jgi:hypothetical protein
MYFVHINKADTNEDHNVAVAVVVSGADNHDHDHDVMV